MSFTAREANAVDLQSAGYTTTCLGESCGKNLKRTVPKDEEDSNAYCKPCRSRRFPTEKTTTTACFTQGCSGRLHTAEPTSAEQVCGKCRKARAAKAWDERAAAVESDPTRHKAWAQSTWNPAEAATDPQYTQHPNYWTFTSDPTNPPPNVPEWSVPDVRTEQQYTADQMQSHNTGAPAPPGTSIQHSGLHTSANLHYEWTYEYMTPPPN